MSAVKMYQLTDYGRAFKYRTWRTIGGCAPPNNTMAMMREGMTLGDIEDQCAFTGRSLARFAAENLGLKEMTNEVVK